LTISNVSKSYGIQQVLDQITFIMTTGQRIGLVGANGVGKSTLLKIIVGELEADSGAIALPTGAQLGYLPQTVDDFDGKTLDELIASSLSRLRQLEAQMRLLEERMAAVTGSELAGVMQEYDAAAEQFERYGGYDMDYRVDSVLNGLGVGHIPRQRQAATLSGGEKARVGLAMLLLQAPDVLLLDEPTNHLDYACLAWLEDYLQGYRGAILIVSHDRQFLNRTVNAIVEIEEHSRRARHYGGNYDAYLQTRAQERRRWQEDFGRQQEEIKALRHEIKTSARQVAHNRPAKDNDKFLKHFKRAQVEKSISHRIRLAEEKLRRIENDPIPKPPDELRFAPDFDPLALKGRAPLVASGVGKVYGPQCVLRDVSFTLGARSRVALVGPNGAGKTTLLKILASLETPDSGEVYLNPQVKIGYLDQEQENLDLEQTVFEAYREGLSGTEQQLKAALLTSGLFRYEELVKTLRQLSSGQRRKLQIARLIAERANLLLLDEPTNFVSFDVLESLEEALKHFPGPVIAVSHDRRFLQTFGGEVWELREGELIKRLHGFEEYLPAAIAVESSL
jgi:macrolide transport system ATP-binding/permease protein